MFCAPLRRGFFISMLMRNAHFSVENLAERLGVDVAAPSAPKVTLTLNDIAQFQIVLILGESGCGKSTVLKSLHDQHPELCVFLNPDDLQWNDDVR